MPINHDAWTHAPYSSCPFRDMPAQPWSGPCWLSTRSRRPDHPTLISILNGLQGHYATCQLCYITKQCHWRSQLMATTDMEIAYSANCQHYCHMTLTTEWDFADSAWRHLLPLPATCLSVPQAENASKCPSVQIHHIEPRPLSPRPNWSANCITRTSGLCGLNAPWSGLH